MVSIEPVFGSFLKLKYLDFFIRQAPGSDERMSKVEWKAQELLTFPFVSKTFPQGKISSR